MTQHREATTAMWAATTKTTDGTTMICGLAWTRDEAAKQAEGAGPDLRVDQVVVGVTTDLDAPLIRLR